jgi:hypothetical protein
VTKRPLGERGQALVEFALVLPVFALLILGLLDFGTAYNDYDDMTQLAGEAARFASVDSCGSGCSSIATQVMLEADNGALVNGSGATGPQGALKICFWYPQGSGVAGEQVQAIVQSSYRWLPYLGLASSSMTATATMRIENPLSGSGDPYSVDANVTASNLHC